uniref:Uncharacterized protein n=1 Tax=Rhizophora mucronata TaxID=61149 RepID=A0A2P2R011_RHIMU
MDFNLLLPWCVQDVFL